MCKVRQHDGIGPKVGSSLCHTLSIHYAVVAAAKHQDRAIQPDWPWQRQV